MRRRVFLLTAAVCVIGIAGSTAAVSVSHGAAAGPAKKRCKWVVRKIHHKRKRVRVCHKVKPKPPKITTMRVDVGGYKLFMMCAGKGSPAVLMEPGFASPADVWDHVLPGVSRFTKACAFERAGVNRSDPRPGTLQPTTAQIVSETHALVHNAGFRTPFVYVGASIGGFDARYYTKQYPDDVAGLVLVDGAPEQAFLTTDTHEIRNGREVMNVWDAANELVGYGTGARALVDLEQGEDTPTDRGWQKTIAQRSTNAWWVVALYRGHNIELPPPDGNPPLVVEAIHQDVKALRNGGRLGSCRKSPLRKLQGDCLKIP